MAYNALSAGVKTQLPLPPMSPDNALPASSEPAAIPANRPFDPAQVTGPVSWHPRHACHVLRKLPKGSGCAYVFLLPIEWLCAAIRCIMQPCGHQWCSAKLFSLAEGGPRRTWIPLEACTGILLHAISSLCLLRKQLIH